MKKNGGGGAVQRQRVLEKEFLKDLEGSKQGITKENLVHFMYCQG